MQARAAAEGNNMKNKMSFFYVNTIKNHVCYNNLNYIYIYINTYTHKGNGLRMERPRSPCEVRESLRQVEKAQGEVRKPKCQKKED